MFREMRRKERAMEKTEIAEILKTATNGVLAVTGDDDYPYAVPLSFVYENNKIYFHSTNENSHKIDAISKNPKVSFCVVTKDEIVPEDFTTSFKSIVVFGKASVLTKKDEILEIMMLIARKYCSSHMSQAPNYAKSYLEEFCIVEIEIEHLTGKTKD
ncbi:MAG: pyridoxamine 5'-phosphate oxidase family protein [Clostridia bacterium]